MRFQILASMLACTAAFATSGAFASEPEPYQDAAYNGGYVIEVLPNNTVDHSQPKCMIFDAAQGAYGVRTHRWTNVATSLCGLGHITAHAENKQAVWDITPVKHTDGRKAYVIRSRVNGQCLMRSNNGLDNTARLFIWNTTNPHLCGLGTEDAVIDNGQAAWVLGESPVEGENLVSSIGALRNGIAYLSFASSNNGLRAGQTMLAVDHMYRLTRVPENCTSHALQPEIIRVCGVGDYSKPVRVRDSDYLKLVFKPWSATMSPGNFYGDSTVHYVTIADKASALLYCSRLRTGNFSDWRLPTREELRKLYAAFPNNKIRDFGWPTGYRGHWTSDGYMSGGRYFFYSVRFFDGSEGEEWDVNPYPISCIR